MQPFRSPSKTSIALALLLGGCGGGGGGSTVSVPTIKAAPQASTSGVGGSVTFRVKAKGGDLTYQWLKDAAPIAGATQAEFTVASVTLDSAGAYAVQITNPKGSVTSEAAVLTVSSAPVIVDAPHDASVVLGSAATFAVTTRGDGPMTYQWTKDGADIVGKTDATLTIPAVAVGDAGAYAVRATNAKGTTTSAPATLAVIAVPTITVQPKATTADAGTPATLAVEVTGTAPLTYQWSKDGADVVRATSATLTIPSPVPNDAGTYRVVVTNAVGAVTSDPARLTVVSVPLITTQPGSAFTAIGSSASFAIVARGGRPLAYQWKKDGAEIPGATGETYTIPSVAAGDLGTYAVTVGNAYGSVASGGAALALGSAPAITSGPARGGIHPTVVVYVTVTGTAPLTYRWTLKGTVIGTSGSVNYLGPGVYTVTVTNAFGSATATSFIP